MQADIEALCITKDSKTFYVGDWGGHMLKMCINKHTILKNYGKQADHIWSMEITSNENYLYQGCDCGKLLQYSLITETLLKDHGNVMDNYIWSLKATPDSNFLFIGDGSGGWVAVSATDRNNPR